ncbi:MAG: Autotransporter-associated beta strand repeat protein, partial [Verrucomicrobiales bacterium]|nr:Autotransporter-associated beta strand repeat protein [Verrucomicrobiales bacterium]
MTPEFPKSSREEQELKITALLMGELSPEEADKVEEMLKADAGLADLHEQMKAALGLIREMTSQGEEDRAEPVKLAAGRREKLLSTFRGEKSEGATNGQPIDWRTWGALAAMVVGLLGVAAVAFRFLLEGSEDRGSRAENQSHINVDWMKGQKSSNYRRAKNVPASTSLPAKPQQQDQSADGRTVLSYSTDGTIALNAKLYGAPAEPPGAKPGAHGGSVFLPTDSNTGEKRLAQVEGREETRTALKLPAGISSDPSQAKAGERPTVLHGDTPEPVTAEIHVDEQKYRLAGDIAQRGIADFDGDGQIALPPDSKKSERFSPMPEENGEKGIGRGKAENRSSFTMRLGSIVNKAASDPGPSGVGRPALANPETGVSGSREPSNTILSVNVGGYLPVPSAAAPRTSPAWSPPAGVPVNRTDLGLTVDSFVPPPAVTAVPAPAAPGPEHSAPPKPVGEAQVASGSKVPAQNSAITGNFIGTDPALAQVTDAEKKGQTTVMFTVATTNLSQPFVVDGGGVDYSFVNGGSLVLPVSTNFHVGISGSPAGFGLNPTPSLGYLNGGMGGGMGGRGKFGEVPNQWYETQLGRYSARLTDDDDAGGLRFLQNPDLQQGLEKNQELSKRTGVTLTKPLDRESRFQTVKEISEGEGLNQLAQQQSRAKPQGPQIANPVPNANTLQETAASPDGKLMTQATGTAPANRELELRERELQNALAAREKLSMRIIQEEVEYALPKQRIVQIIDRAEPKKANLWDKVRGDVASTVRIKVEKYGSDVAGLGAEGFGDGGFDPYWIQDQFETIQSKSVLYKVIEKLKLDSAWGLTTEQAYKSLRDKIEAKQ